MRILFSRVDYRNHLYYACSSEVIYDYNLIVWYKDWYENDCRRICVPSWLILYKDVDLITVQKPVCLIIQNHEG